MKPKQNRICPSGKSLIFACSGAADVGELSDQAARQLSREGFGKMFCLAGIGGQVEGIIKGTSSAERILAIDGCALNCTKLCLEKAGFSKMDHMQLSNLGFEKGKTEISTTTISKVVTTAKAIWAEV